MIKNIVINDKAYQLPLENAIIGETSGTCYHLKEKNVDWAVKLYHGQEDDWEDSIYPTLDELKKICAVRKRVQPVLVSEYPVFDTEQNYIGCCSPFIYETEGAVEEVLYQKPIDFILEELYKIEKTLPIFTKENICTADWSIENTKIGKIKRGSYGMYLFDDSCYSIIESIQDRNEEEKLRDLNQQNLNHLIVTFIAKYFYLCETTPISNSERYNQWRYLNQITSAGKSVLSLLKEQAREYKTLGKYLDQVKERGYR